MLKDSNVLLIGGVGRNVGKTEFVCRVIEKISQTHQVYGLKVSVIYPDERLFHGSHSDELEQSRLFEETSADSRKDTSRMLRAGALQVFYLQSDEAGILKGYKEFRKIIPENAVIVCESNSLGEVLVPGLSIMVKSETSEIKPRAIAQLKRADLTIVSDGVSGFTELNSIAFEDKKGWYLE